MPNQEYNYSNNLYTTVATVRAPGGSTIQVADPDKFAAVEWPVRLSVLRDDGSLYGLLIAIFRATGIVGSEIAVDGVLEGTVDSTIEVGDLVMVAQTAGDFDDLWNALEEIETTPGPQGAPGADGGTGPQGDRGSQGFQGAAGLQGVQGATGPQGDRGPQGATGVQGATGPQGSAGLQGSQGATGPQGAAGLQGVQGAAGAQGLRGFQGDRGPQGYQGYQGLGTQGPQGGGTQGPQGAPGVGTQGNQGTQGVQGSQGGGSSLALGAAVSGATNNRLLNITSGNLSQSANLSFDGSTLEVQGAVNLKNTVGSVASTFDANGYGFVYTMSFSLAKLVDLATGTDLTRGGQIAGFAGTISKVKIQATTNGSSGGFTLQINKNGTSIFTSNPTVAASTTTVQSFTPTTTTMAENDVLTVDCTSTGTSVQNVMVTIYALVRNA